MKLLVKRLRPNEPFTMPTLSGPEGVLYLSRAMVLRPKCTGVATTNTVLFPPNDCAIIVYPLPELLHRHWLLMPTVVAMGPYRDGVTLVSPKEITMSVRNPSEHSVKLKPGDALLGFLIVRTEPFTSGFTQPALV